MLLKKYNEKTAQYQNMSARIRIHSRGRISLNKGAINLLDIKEGDRFEFLQDEQSPKDWYIHKSKDGFKCLLTTKDEIRLHSVTTSVAILTSIGFTGATYSFPISHHKKEFLGAIIYPILTAAFSKEEKLNHNGIRPGSSPGMVQN